MIDKLTRLWLSPDTMRESIDASFDSEWNKGIYEQMIARFVAETDANNSLPHIKGPEALEAYFRRTYKFRDDSYFRFSSNVDATTRFTYSERLNFWRLWSTEPFPNDDEEPGFKFYGYMGCISYDDDEGYPYLFHADLGNDAPTAPTPIKNALTSPRSGCPFSAATPGSAAATSNLPLKSNKSGFRLFLPMKSKRGKSRFDRRRKTQQKTRHLIERRVF